MALERMARSRNGVPANAVTVQQAVHSAGSGMDELEDVRKEISSVDEKILQALSQRSTCRTSATLTSQAM